MNWSLLPPNQAAADNLIRELQVSPLLAQLLVNRGICEATAARAFLKPNLNNLSDPANLSGMATALGRIDRALKNKEPITIYGDYDTDGVTATALLFKMFQFLGTTVDYYIPHRLDEGYSLNHKAIEKIARNGTKLLITVDCGITDCAEAAHARQLGMDMIITDHHEPARADDGSFLLPEVTAIINPKSTDRPGEAAGSRELSGVGVAFKLAWAMLDRLSPGRKRTPEFQQFLAEAIALIVVGTIADVVPLSGENRILTAYGLPLLKSLSLPWLDALIEKSRLNRRYLNARDISFRIGPRLNAGGRLGNAETSLQILLTPDRPHAAELAGILEKANQDRQKIEKRIIDETRKTIQSELDLERDYVIVLANARWHSGVVGIVAAKLAEEFHRPTVLLTIKGASAKGSARSIPTFNLYEGLLHCRKFLTKFGGHSYAAGVEVAADKLEDFRAALNRYAHAKLQPADFIPCLEVDTEAEFDRITLATVREMEQLAPFGEGNPEPLLLSRNVLLAGEPRLCGTNDEHCTFIARQNSKSSHRVIAFGMGKRWEEILRLTGRPFQIVYTPQIDTWNGQTSVVLNLKDFRVG